MAYYDTTKRDYRIIWRSSRSLGIHFGYYDDRHLSHDAAVLNINRKLADMADITDRDNVLDAGCGIGGSALWLAANRSCRATGINIVPWQIERARMLAEQRGLQKLVNFQQADYADTKLSEGSFTVFWGLESIVHAEDKQVVINEAFRLLKPGGRLVISEYLLSKAVLEPDDKVELTRWLNGWAMPGLLTEEEYKSLALGAGFTDFVVHDWTERIRPSLDRLNRFVKIFKPIAPILHALGLANEGQLGNLTASEAQMKLLRDNIWRYKVILAKKPHNKF